MIGGTHIPSDRERSTALVLADMRAAVDSLSEAQREALMHIAKGLTTTEAAAIAGVGVHAVHDRRRNVYRKLGVGSACEAAVIAAKVGLV